MKAFILMIILLAGCAAEQISTEQQTYKEYCAEKGGAWMKMSELKEGKPTGNTCYGCMPDDKNHICMQQEYEEFIK